MELSRDDLEKGGGKCEKHDHKEKAEQQDILLKLAEENERIVNNRYKSGLVSFLEVATAQNQTLNTRRTRLNTAADRLQAALQLAAVIGGGWDLNDPVVQSVSFKAETDAEELE